MAARTTTPTDENQTQASQGSRAGAFSAVLVRRLPRTKMMLLLALAVVSLNVLHVRAYPVVSPFGEIHHLDYLTRASTGHPLVQPDDQLTQDSLRDVSCRRHELELVPRGVKDPTSFPACGDGPFDARDFVWRGYNAAGEHPPHYYVVTAVAARALSAAIPSGILVTWGRVLGSVWLLVGFYLVLRAAEHLGIDRLALGFVLLVVAAVPAVLHASATVNPDASAFAAGAAVLLAALAWERSARRLWLAALVAFLCVPLDVTSLAAVVLVSGYLVVRGWAARTGAAQDPVRSWPSYVRAAAVISGAGIAGILAWGALHALWAHDVDLARHPLRLAFHVDSLDAGQVLGRDTLFASLPGVDSPFVPGVLRTTPYATLTGAAVVLISGAVIAAALSSGMPTGRLSTLTVCTLAALILTPPLFVLYNFLVTHAYFEIQPRHGLSLLPASALVVAGFARTPLARVLVGVVGVGLWLAAVSALI